MLALVLSERGSIRHLNIEWRGEQKCTVPVAGALAGSKLLRIRLEVVTMDE